MLTHVLVCSSTTVAGQVWYSAVSKQQVPAIVDQLAILSVAVFFLIQAGFIVWINEGWRNAVIAVLRCRRPGSVLPSARDSKELEGVQTTTINDDGRATPRGLTAQSRAPSSARRHTLDRNRKSFTTNGLLSSPLANLPVRQLDQRNSYSSFLTRSDHAGHHSDHNSVVGSQGPSFQTLTSVLPAHSPSQQHRRAMLDAASFVRAEEAAHEAEVQCMQLASCGEPHYHLAAAVNTTSTSSHRPTHLQQGLSINLMPPDAVELVRSVTG